MDEREDEARSPHGSVGDGRPRTVHVRVRDDVARHVRRGHPWVYRRGLTRDARDARAGDVAVIHDEKNAHVGIGLYDDEGDIAVRVLATKRHTLIDAAFLRSRIREAMALRAPLLEDCDDEGPRTDGFRVVFGESDGLPGLVVDRYADVLVVKLYTAAWFAWLDALVPMLVDELTAPAPARHVVLRLARNVTSPRAVWHDGALLSGAPLDDELIFREHGLRFVVDPVRGQKTGFFLDQRDNRARVGALSAGRRVLNVFSYSGGFSLAAARGGATAVTSLDLARPALVDAERNFALNRDDPRVAAARHDVLCGDAFSLLAELRERKTLFDVVVLDPPAFARRSAHVEDALTSYTRLAGLGLDVLEQGGTLVFASCSAHVTADMLVSCAERAAASRGRPLTVVDVTGHALDHPARFAEAGYLKCVFARA